MLKEQKRKILSGALGYWLLAEFCAFMVCVGLMFTRAMGVGANIIFGVCALLVLILLFADYSVKRGIMMRKAVGSFKDPDMLVKYESFGLYIGIVGAIPCYITAILELLSRLGVIGNFHPLYKLLNMYFMPLFDLIAHDADVMLMPYPALIFVFLMPLVIPATTYIAYKVGYKNIEVVESLVYKKK